MANGNSKKRLTGRTGRLRARLDREDEDRFAERVVQQWSQARAGRRETVRSPAIEAGPSNFTRAEVPWALDLTAAWSWRLIVITIAGLGLAWAIRFFAVITLPLAIGLLAAALAAPLVDLAVRARLPRQLASALTVLLGLGVLGLLLTFVGQQVAEGFADLTDQVVKGLEEVRFWLREGPLQASESQINDALRAVQEGLTASSEQMVARATEVGTAIGYILAAFFIALFASYFFLADGARIWAWVVRLFPRAARVQVDESGRVAWRSLTQFIRATVMIAGVDAVGIMIVAAVLDVPLVFAIGVLVFLGGFVPIVGAFVSGGVAVLVALVAQGPIVALLMLLGVVVVQQVESNVLQPFLMGRFVSVHPLGVLVVIGMGILVAGVAGALVAVPLAASVNAVAQHLAARTSVGEDPVEGPSADEGAVGDEVEA